MLDASAPRASRPTATAYGRSSCSAQLLDRIVSSRLCTGCGGCAAAVPDGVRMAPSADGFIRPVARGRLTAQEERRIDRICPGTRLTRQPTASKDHPLWGTIVAARTGHATDPALRRIASSGGALSAILVHLLRSGAVDFIVETTVDPADPTGNITVESRDTSAIFEAAGSRYAPSAPLAALERHLARPGRFAFVGKPCDVAALRALAREDPRIGAKVPVMISFFCAGVPGRSGSKAVLEAMGADPSQVGRFRYRGDGWPGNAAATMRDGRRHRMSYDDSWGKILTGHVQFRCRICPDGSGGFADIVCADAWHLDGQGRPCFDEAEGRSLILTRSATGEGIVAAAQAAGRLETAPLPVEAIAAMQPGQVAKRRAVLARLSALAMAGQRVPAFRGFHLGRTAAALGLLGNLRNLLGTWKRLWLGRCQG